MRQDIKIIDNRPVWKVILYSISIYAVVFLILGLALRIEFSIVSMATSLIIGIPFVLFSRRPRDSNMTLEGEEVFLHGIKANLELKSWFFLGKYVQVTSLTKTGYHRLRVMKHQVKLNEWERLLALCTSSVSIPPMD